MSDIRALAAINGPCEVAERMGFVRWINYSLEFNDIVRRHIPIDPDSYDIYDKTTDGLIFIELLNFFFPQCISNEAIHTDFNLSRYEKLENLTLAFITASCYGCDLRRVDIFQLYSSVKMSTLEFLWQIFRVGFTYDISLLNCPELIVLRKPTEHTIDLRAISSTELVLRYINYQLNKTIFNPTVLSFFDDFSDGSVYLGLVGKICDSELNRTSENNSGNQDKQVQKIIGIITLLNQKELGFFLQSDDFIQNDESRRMSTWKLHYLTFHLIFKRYRLESPPIYNDEKIHVDKERNGEFYLRNFLNSFGVDPYCNDLAPNTRNSLLIIQAFEELDRFSFRKINFIKHFSPDLAQSERVHNASFMLMKLDECKLKERHIYPEMVAKANQTTIMRVIFAVMMLWLENGKISSNTVMTWVNEMLEGEFSIHSFRDLLISEEHLFGHVLNKIEPNCVDFELMEKLTKLEFVNYYVSVARRLGYLIFTIPNQFVTSEAEPVMMAFAVLMHGRKHPNISCQEKI